MKYYTVGASCVIVTQKMLKDTDSMQVFSKNCVIIL